MSSKKLRALRNRQDRTKLHNRNFSQQNEPFMSEIERENALFNESSSKQEPKLNMEDEFMNSEPQNPKMGDVLKEQFDELNLSKSKESVSEETLKEESVAKSSETDEKADTEAKVNGESADSSKALEESISQTNAQPAADDPDRVPVSTSLSDDEVPNMPGAILLHAREILGLSQREVAHKLNLRVNSVSDIEHDRLNQPTAVPFASVHIANYAKLVNIDPEYLVSLYKQRVKANVAAVEGERDEPKEKRSLKMPIMAACVLGLIVLSVGVTVSLLSSSSSKTSGALVIEDTVEASQDNDGNILMDTENSKLKTNIVTEEPLVDPNTQMAKAQADSLDTDEIISSNTASHNEILKTGTDAALKVKGKAAEKIEQTVAKAPEIKLNEQKSDLKSVSLETTQKLESDDNQLSKAKESATVNTESLKAQVKKVDEAQDKVNTKTEKAEETVNNAAVALSSSVRDISSSVRLAGKRDPFESMNSVTIRVSGDVSLKVTGNGKVLKQGTYKSGDVVKAMGIPPLKVSVSDSSKVRVSYMGTSVVVPKSQQVSFTLPTR